jgi:hypothetical protein
MAKSMGVSNVSWPCHMVPIQLKNFTPVGIAMSSVLNMKNGSSTGENRECEQHEQAGEAHVSGEDGHPPHHHPGARRHTTVVTILTAVRMVPRPARVRPMIHRLPPGPGECMARRAGRMLSTRSRRRRGSGTR